MVKGVLWSWTWTSTWTSFWCGWS